MRQGGGAAAKIFAKPRNDVPPGSYGEGKKSPRASNDDIEEATSPRIFMLRGTNDSKNSPRKPPAPYPVDVERDAEKARSLAANATRGPATFLPNTCPHRRSPLLACANAWASAFDFGCLIYSSRPIAPHSFESCARV